jgi:NitT/TauT family transport system substrate-binding protein
LTEIYYSEIEFSVTKWFTRKFVHFVVALGSVVGACHRVEHPEILRVGYMPNLTHAPALTGISSGRFASALPAHTSLRALTFTAGSTEIEALLAGELDVAFVGPGPAVVAHIRSHGRAVRVLAGVASGGASFVVNPNRHIRQPSDLHGRVLATPQLGNTQDIALRHYLHAHQLRTLEEGGDVRVMPIAPATILTQFLAGQLDGAWVAEPWATRLVSEAHGEVLIDERTLWPDGQFSTTLLLARTRWLETAPAVAQSLVHALENEVARTTQNRTVSMQETNAAIGAITQHPLRPSVLQNAWVHIDFSVAPLQQTVQATALAAEALGYIPSHNLEGMFDTRFLSDNSR